MTAKELRKRVLNLLSGDYNTGNGGSFWFPPAVVAKALKVTHDELSEALMELRDDGEVVSYTSNSGNSKGWSLSERYAEWRAAGKNDYEPYSYSVKGEY